MNWCVSPKTETELKIGGPSPHPKPILWTKFSQLRPLPANWCASQKTCFGYCLSKVICLSATVITTVTYSITCSLLPLDLNLIPVDSSLILINYFYILQMLLSFKTLKNQLTPSCTSQLLVCYSATICTSAFNALKRLFCRALNMTTSLKCFYKQSRTRVWFIRLNKYFLTAIIIFFTSSLKEI